jgi:hypothetical protein
MTFADPRSIDAAQLTAALAAQRDSAGGRRMPVSDAA